MCYKLKLIGSVLTVFYAGYSCNQVIDQPLDFEVLFTSSSEDVACYRIPALVTAVNGDLIAAIDQRVSSCKDLRDNPNINIVIRRSTDNGRSWQEPELVVDYPDGQSASDPSFVVDHETGEIFMFYNYMDLEKEKGIYYLHVTSSRDYGITWDKPEDITHQITLPDWHGEFKFITSGRGIQTRSGKLLHTLVHVEKGAYVFSSEDHGRSWFLIDRPLDPGDESKIIELENGMWMVNSRVNGSGIRYVHTSSDEGLTWSTYADSTLTDPGCNASLVTLEANGTELLLFSNAYDPDRRENLNVRVSQDQGHTWNDGLTIYKGSAAYSSMTVLANGDIGIFFEKDNYSKNVYTTIPVSSLPGTIRD